MSGISEDLLAKFREMKFIPDKRADGWWVTNVVKYFGEQTSPFQDCMMLCKARETLGNDVYCRYRLYYHELRTLMISVREEDVEHVHAALYQYEQEIPKSEHFKSTRIYWENAPCFIDLYECTNEYLFTADARMILANPNTTDPKKRVQYNRMVDNITHIAKRFILDFPEREVRDDLLYRMSRANLIRPATTAIERKWLKYQNIWALSDKIDEISPRTPAEQNTILRKYFPITKEAFLRFLIDHPEEIRTNTQEEDTIDDSAQIVPNNTTDNDLMRNIDVVRGRGMYLSHSHTYENWTPRDTERRMILETTIRR